MGKALARTMAGDWAEGLEEGADLRRHPAGGKGGSRAGARGQLGWQVSWLELLEHRI